MWRYPPDLVAALEPLGLQPRPETPPAFARAAIDDLYRYELRRARNGVRAGGVDKPSYFDVIVELRKKYWMLTLPLAAWERICTETPV
jgi:hypothetical protein